MKRPASVVQSPAIACKPSVIDDTPKVNTESPAAEAMWAHFKDRKHLFIEDIRLYRTSILAALIAGTPVEDAFKPYLKPPSTVKPARLPAKL